MLVPVRARHKTNAEKLIDYYYEPPVAAQLAAYINYVCPVDGVQEEMAKIDPSRGDNPLILPDKAMAGEVARLPLAQPRRKRRRTRRSSPSSSAPDGLASSALRHHWDRDP